MNNTATSSKLICSLTALLILGNAIIFMPVKSGGGSLFSIVLCFAACILLLCLFKNFNPDNIFSNNAGKVFGFFVLIFALLCAVTATTDFAIVANKRILSNENYFIFSFIFSLLIYFVLTAREQMVFKLSLIFLVLIIFCEAVLFLLSLNQFDPSNFKELSFSGTSSEAINLFATCTAPCLLLPFVLENKKSTPKGVFWGLVFGFSLILFPLLQILFIFGFSYSQDQVFPFLSVLETVSLGLKFSRLEGLSYIIFFFGVLIKCSVCLVFAKKLFSRFLKKAGKHLPLFLSIAVFCLSLLSPLIYKIRSYINALLCLLTLLLIITLALLKSHTHFRCKTK